MQQLQLHDQHDEQYATITSNMPQPLKMNHIHELKPGR